MVWPGVAVAALALMASLALGFSEYLASQRRVVELEAVLTRLEALEAEEKRLRTEVDTINRRAALGGL
jgi:hypothetical protein